MIGTVFRELRKERGWQQGETAEKIGISQTHLSKIERGDIDKPHMTTTRDLLDVLGVQPDRFIKQVLHDTDPESLLRIAQNDSQSPYGENRDD